VMQQPATAAAPGDGQLQQLLMATSGSLRLTAGCCQALQRRRQPRRLTRLSASADSSAAGARCTMPPYQRGGWHSKRTCWGNGSRGSFLSALQACMHMHGMRGGRSNAPSPLHTCAHSIRSLDSP
jgi:hypothetical protein